MDFVSEYAYEKVGEKTHFIRSIYCRLIDVLALFRQHFPSGSVDIIRCMFAKEEVAHFFSGGLFNL